MAETPGEIILRRSGMPPLAFRGELLARAGADPTDGRKPSRWHELALYRTAAGRYVVAINYKTTWTNRKGVEDGRDEAMHAPTAHEVIDALRGHDPLCALQGYPKAPEYEEKQRLLEESICRRYDEAVARLYDQLDPGVFAERID